MKLSTTKLQLVIWRDAEADVEWKFRDADIFKDDTLVCSVGWLIAGDDNRILLAADIDRRGYSNRTLQIPIGCIVSQKTLKTAVVVL